MKDQNKMLSSVFILFLFLATTGCATIQTIDASRVETIAMADLMANPDQMKNLPEKMKNDGETIIKFSRGEIIPLKMNLDLPFATLESMDNKLVVTQDLYIYLSKKQMLFSPDGERWISIEDWRTEEAKKLFGYKAGHLSFGLENSEENGAYLEMIVNTIR